MTDVDICNQALSHLGDRQITGIDAGTTATDALAELCATFYPRARQEALAAQRWTFAKKFAVLAEDDTITTYGFTYAHTLPTDSLRFLRMVPGSQIFDTDGVTVLEISYADRKIDKFKIVGTEVWSDHEFVAMEYIRDFTGSDDPDLWSPHFQAAVARLLAAKLAGPLTDNPQEENNQMRIYETVALPNAQYYDAVQDNSGENSEHESRLAGSKYLQSRYRGSYGQTEHIDNY